MFLNVVCFLQRQSETSSSSAQFAVCWFEVGVFSAGTRRKAVDSSRYERVWRPRRGARSSSFPAALAPSLSRRRLRFELLGV